MIHHLSFAVANLEAAASLYDAALSQLGVVRVWSNDRAVGYGVDDGEDLVSLHLVKQEWVPPAKGLHLAFSARTRQQVDNFHFAALQHGGRDNGAPGLRPRYGPLYYAAFIIDLDGYHIEAVMSA